MMNSDLPTLSNDVSQQLDLFFNAVNSQYNRSQTNNFPLAINFGDEVNPPRVDSPGPASQLWNIVEATNQLSPQMKDILQQLVRSEEEALKHRLEIYFALSRVGQSQGPAMDEVDFVRKALANVNDTLLEIRKAVQNIQNAGLVVM